MVAATARPAQTGRKATFFTKYRQPALRPEKKVFRC